MNDTKRELWQSQNFLYRDEFIHFLISKANIKSQSNVIEIGPGKGSITRQLLLKSNNVTAVEYDHELFEELQKSFKNDTRLKLIEADFLDWTLPVGEYIVFSNIPFNLTSDIVAKLTLSTNPPTDAYLIMQDKAAQRFKGRDKQYTQMAIQLFPWFDIHILEKISKSEFRPTPNVDTVLTHFHKREKPLISNSHRQIFVDFVVYGFNQWKGTLLQSFEKVFTPRQLVVMDGNLKLGKSKPSEASPNQWLELFNSFLKYVPYESKREVVGYEQKHKIKHFGMQKKHRTR